MWCHLGNQFEVEHVTFSVFYLIEFRIRRGKFCWKPHLNQTSGSKVNNWKILETIENKRNAFPFLAVSHIQCCQLPIDPARSQHKLYSIIHLYWGKWQTNKLTNKRRINQFTGLIYLINYLTLILNWAMHPTSINLYYLFIYLYI